MGHYVALFYPKKLQTMKLCIVLAVLVAVSCAQQFGGNHGDHGQHGGDPFMHIVHTEVQAIIAANSGISSAECEIKCDAVFNMMDQNDETSTDDHCKHACQCDIDHNCSHPTGQPGQHGGHMPPSN